MITLICKKCKKPFDVLPYRKNIAVCCSRKCLWHITKATREKKRIMAIKGKKAINNAQISINCKYCKNIFKISPSRENISKFCSKKCYTFAQTINTKKSNRYKRVTISGKRMLEHRYIMEAHLKRPLKRNEHVHHINHNPIDNRIDNLEIIDIKEHAKLHAHGPY